MPRISDIEKLYFEWLTDKVCDSYQKRVYSKMLKELHSMIFTWSMERDANRAEDGKALRNDWVRETHYDHYIPGSFYSKECSVLEMMVALAERCEDIMCDFDKGDQSYVWFWAMIRNIGLETEDNTRIEYGYLHSKIDTMLNREYNSDGSNGGLFEIRNCRKNLRKMEIWYQMHAWLNTVVDD